MEQWLNAHWDEVESLHHSMAFGSLINAHTHTHFFERMSERTMTCNLEFIFIFARCRFIYLIKIFIHSSVFNLVDFIPSPLFPPTSIDSPPFLFILFSLFRFRARNSPFCWLSFIQFYTLSVWQMHTIVHMECKSKAHEKCILR